MLAHVVELAESNDFRLVDLCDRKPRACGDDQAGRIVPCGQIGGQQCDMFTRRIGIDHEGGKDTRDACQRQCNLGFGQPGQRFGTERSFQRSGKVERGIGNGARLGKVHRIGAADQYRMMPVGRLALVGQLERGSARG